MSKCIQNYLNEYIIEKRSLGYKYVTELYPLKKFVLICDADSTTVPDEKVKAWALRRANEKDNTYRCRIYVINKFIDYLNKYDFKISKIHLSNAKSHETFIPIILSYNEVTRVFEILDDLKKSHGSNGCIDYPVMFRIMYGCGLRVSEVINLKIKNFDIENKLLIILNPKNKQDKLIPLSDSLFNILDLYHNSFHKNIETDAYFFKSRFNKHYSRSTLNHMWVWTLDKAGIHHDSDKGPRLHDLRHLFCCLSLKQLIDNGDDPYVVLPILSTYVGHKSTNSTEKYLQLSSYNYEYLLDKFLLIEKEIFHEK